MVWISFFDVNVQVTLGPGAAKQQQALGPVFKTEVFDVGVAMVYLTLQNLAPA
jgi:hypothetical protein